MNVAEDSIAIQPAKTTLVERSITDAKRKGAKQRACVMFLTIIVAMDISANIVSYFGVVHA